MPIIVRNVHKMFYYYANIVGKKIEEATNVKNISSNSESELPNKKKQKLNEQISISSFTKIKS